MCNLATQIMTFTSADSYNDKDSVKAWQSTFQFISTVCIERFFFFQQQRRKQLLSFRWTLCSLKSYQKASLAVQALQGSDVTSTVTLRWWLTYASHELQEEKKKHTHTTHILFVSDDISDFTLTCFVKTIPEEIKRHITQVKPET